MTVEGGGINSVGRDRYYKVDAESVAVAVDNEKNVEGGWGKDEVSR